MEATTIQNYWTVQKLISLMLSININSFNDTKYLGRGHNARL